MVRTSCFIFAIAFGLTPIGSIRVNAQQAGTTGIDGLYDATQGTGSDIGAKINNLCATYSAFSPTIELPAGTYSFSTTLNAGGVQCTILGMGKSASILQYTGTGVAEEGYNLHDLKLIGSGSGTGIVLNSPLAVIDNIELGSSANPFATGMTVASNVYLDRVSNSHISYNTQNFYFPGSQSPNNSGENIVFDHVVFANGGTFANCVQIGDLGWDGPQVTFYSPSFDGCQWVNDDSAVTMYAPHFEAVTPQNGPYGITTADYYAGYPTNSTTLYNPQIFQNVKVTANGLFEVNRFGALNIDGMVDRTLEGPLVYLNVGGGGQPTLQVIAPDNIRTASQLYAVAGGTTPHLTVLTSTVLNLNAPNGLMLNGIPVLPSSLTGTHGSGTLLQTSDTSGQSGDLPIYAPDGSLTDSGFGRTLTGTHGAGTKLQTSDSSGPSGDLPMYAPDGSLTDSGFGRTSYPIKSGTASSPHVACWLNGGTLGQCTTQPDASGSCTCK
jgi:hypothetical protein